MPDVIGGGIGSGSSGPSISGGQWVPLGPNGTVVTTPTLPPVPSSPQEFHLSLQGTVPSTTPIAPNGTTVLMTPHVPIGALPVNSQGIALSGPLTGTLPPAGTPTIVVLPGQTFTINPVTGLTTGGAFLTAGGSPVIGGQLTTFTPVTVVPGGFSTTPPPVAAPTPTITVSQIHPTIIQGGQYTGGAGFLLVHPTPQQANAMPIPGPAGPLNGVAGYIDPPSPTQIAAYNNMVAQLQAMGLPPTIGSLNQLGITATGGNALYVQVGQAYANSGLSAPLLAPLNPIQGQPQGFNPAPGGVAPPPFLGPVPGQPLPLVPFPQQRAPAAPMVGAGFGFGAGGAGGGGLLGGYQGGSAGGGGGGGGLLG